MRKAFIKTLVEIAEYDNRVYLLTADMGFGLVEPFAEAYPERFINVGVAEQNMIGIATGLALSGKVVFVYSITNFPTFRCLEQIRNDVCYHNLKVHIVAGSTGLTYGELGSSHHATEDIDVMRSLPNMAVIAPGSPSEVSLLTKAIYEYRSPCYLRLGNSGYSAINPSSRSVKIGKANTMIVGRDVVLIATGSMLNTTLQAAKQLGGMGIRAIVLNMHTIKPIDKEAIISSSKIAGTIITIEEHSIIGGLGSAVAEVLAENNSRVKFKRMGIPDAFCTQVGTQSQLLVDCHLTIYDIVREVENAIR